jgi:hypothetical protein
LKRHPDLDREEFKALYESRHARLGERHACRAVRYVRRYLEALPGLFTGFVAEPDHDVITELWYQNQADYEADMAHLSQPEVLAEIVADEETFSIAASTGCSRWRSAIHPKYTCRLGTIRGKPLWFYRSA